MDNDGYCHVCRRSDFRGMKHLYTKKHKDRVKHILSKFEIKMETAKDCTVSGLSIAQYEASHADENFWCPFCSAEVPKHERQGQCSIMFKAWVNHLCSSDHHKKVHSFFWTNKLDMKRRDQYKLNQEMAEEVENLARRNLERYLQISNKVIQLEAKQIREVERQRGLLRGALPGSDGSREITTNSDTLATNQPDTADGLKHEAHNEGHTSNDATLPQTERLAEVNVSTVPGLDANSCQSGQLEKWHPETIATTNSTAHSNNEGKKSEFGVSSLMMSQQSLTVGHLAERNDFQSRQSTSVIQACWNKTLPSSLVQAETSGHQSGQIPGTRGPIGKRTSWRNQPGSSGTDIDPLLQDVKPRKAAEVISSGGLTVISRKRSRLRGNIHTDAVPPWMMEDNSEGTVKKSVSIGPTVEDYNKHLERERKRKLNPQRVGANFDHDAETSEQWLPSFGRVWNHGPRWRSRKQYRKEAVEKTEKPRS